MTAIDIYFAHNKYPELYRSLHHESATVISSACWPNISRTARFGDQKSQGLHSYRHSWKEIY
jgi:hypothetical protein